MTKDVMTEKPASCSVFFDDVNVMVVARRGPLSSWFSVLPLPVEDSVLGAQIVAAWEARERGDGPDSKTAEEIHESESPIRELFDEEFLQRVRMVGVNRVRGKIAAGWTELKGDDNRYFGPRPQKLPLDADEAAIGEAAKQAMALTLS